MPIFPTPAPITVELSLVSANVRINATDRIDTVVEVRPAKESNKHDVTAADQTEVSFHNGTLVVRMAKPKLLGGKGTINLVIDLPTGSQLKGDSAIADLRAAGLLGDCHFTTATGDLQFDHTGPLRLETTSGRIRVEHADGHTDVTSGSGEIWLHTVNGTAVVKNSNGPTTIGDITGDLRVNVANGNTSIERAHSTVAVKAAAGSIHIGELTRGTAVLETNAGDVELGIRQGTAAYLDINTLTGRFINDLATIGGPETNTETLKVHARTVTGDIIVRRSQPAAA
ncbi:hypothetical protein N8J89_39890 [Crossiella sp. CA-258035]|uniref:DUF4097 family beta strand repeat-containing protein n=1 Tax=Crossiella sp. CA-258035 TaxID=2981138 RepID=UPI0024BC916C|nr:DUF4097 family beta strand repeat-containing protein [Crossiella sp. CA-258035]WHT19187.1 hypothetical protein N8J89_39890 [Crossiella sp. CA-258035]